MTVPACNTCNKAFSEDEELLAVILAHVSFEDDLMWERRQGVVARALERDTRLREFLERNTDKDGTFWVTADTWGRMSRIFIKTVQGLYYLHYGRAVPAENVGVLSIEHQRQCCADELLEEYPDQDTSGGMGGWPEVTPDGRGLERAILGLPRGKERRWVDYQAGVFRYTLAKGSEGRLVCILDLHKTLAVAVKCPWPAKAGPAGGMSRSQ